MTIRCVGIEIWEKVYKSIRSSERRRTYAQDRDQQSLLPQVSACSLNLDSVSKLSIRKGISSSVN